MTKMAEISLNWYPIYDQQQQQLLFPYKQQLVFPYKYMVLPTKVLERKKNYIINHITRDCFKSIHKWT